MLLPSCHTESQNTCVFLNNPVLTECGPQELRCSCYQESYWGGKLDRPPAAKGVETGKRPGSCSLSPPLAHSFSKYEVRSCCDQVTILILGSKPRVHECRRQDRAVSKCQPWVSTRAPPGELQPALSEPPHWFVRPCNKTLGFYTANDQVKGHHHDGLVISQTMG